MSVLLASAPSQTRTMTVYRKGVPVTFETPYSDAQAYARLKSVPGEFASDLYARGPISLSRNQWPWVHKLVVDHERPRQPAPVLAGANFSGLISLFTTAAEWLKYPKITLEVDGRTVKFSRCGVQSKYPGCVNVTNGVRYGEPGAMFFGRVGTDGSLTEGRDLTPDVRALMLKLSTDPVGFAAHYGHVSGSCCFCNIKLDDPRSTEVGYGPICAKHYGLPWGK